METKNLSDDYEEFAKRYLDKVKPKKSKQPNNNKRFNINFKKILKYLGIFFLLGCFAILMLYFMVLSGSFGEIPSQNELKAIKNANASGIYTADNKLLGKYYIQNRTELQYSDIAPSVVNALVATEDARFYEHSGIDYRSLGRVVVKTILLQKEKSGGGSTISQQLAKNLYPRQDFPIIGIVINKMREMIVAQRLEDIYNKEDLLTLYLNTVPFGGNVFGIEAGAQRFFNTSAKKLKPEQAAVLIGMLKATTSYNPRLYPEKSLARRNVVLDQMLKYGYLGEEATAALKEKPLEINYNATTHNEGLATYFREYLRQELNKWCKTHQKPDGTNYNIYTDGLKIYTTIDSRMQKYAELAMEEHLKDLQKVFDAHWKDQKPWGKNSSLIEFAVKQSPRYKQLKDNGLDWKEINKIFATPVEMEIFTWEGEKTTKMSPLDSVAHYLQFLHAGLLSMEAKTGYVRAWVGGINHKYFQYDHVTSTRQVGSTFKPIVYAAALESGRNPCEFIENIQRTYPTEDNWTPGNADGEYGGQYSMQGGLVKSVNTISAELVWQTGVPKTIKLAHDMGVKSKLPDGPAIALGAADISLLEMVSVYSTFANRGLVAEPVYLLKIEDAEGNLVADFRKPASKNWVLKKETADMMVEMMRNVVNMGTAQRLRGSKYGIKTDVAGKTGTTQDNTDGWFIGFTPELVTGVWVGGEARQIRFRSLQLGQGANTALPIWAKYMRKIYADGGFDKLEQATFASLNDSLAFVMACPMFIPEFDSLLVEIEPDSLGIDRETLFKLERQKDKDLRKAEKEAEKEEKRLERERKREERKEEGKENVFDHLRNIFGKKKKD
ncbi:MAG: transglycosylase domain-containing protein [Chitinophagales bacterium]